MKRYLLLLFLVFSIPSNADERHEHNGKLEAYISEPPKLHLLDEEKQVLASGKPVYKKIKLGDVSRGIVVIRINANADTVWSVIKDFKFYPQWIADMKSIEVYKRSKGLLYVQFTADGGLLGDKSWYVVHDYPRIDEDLSSRNWGTWKLDYEHRSDIDDNVGFWRVEPVDGHYEQVDVVYSTDVRLKGFFASLFESTLVDKGLKDATQWVKRQSELRAQMQNLVAE